MTVLRRFLRDRRRNTGWWLFGVTLTVAISVVFYPSIEGQASYDELAEEMPEAVRELFGVDAFGMSTPEGFMWSQLIGTTLPVLLLVFGIAAGARAIGGTEEDGTLELLLANPVTRRRVLLERFGAVVLLLAVLTVAMLVVTVGVALPVGAIEGIPGVWVLGSFLALFALGLLHAMIAFAVGSAIGRRGRAIAVAAAVGVAGYVFEGLGSVVDVLGPLQAISPFHWFLERNMLGSGIAWLAVWLPLLLSAVLLVVALQVFERRDLR